MCHICLGRVILVGVPVLVHHQDMGRAVAHCHQLTLFRGHYA